MLENLKDTVELGGMLPQYLLKLKKPLSELERTTLSTLLNYDLAKAYKQDQIPKNHSNQNKSKPLSVNENSQIFFYYFFSQEDLTYSQFKKISELNPLKFIIHKKDLEKFIKADPSINKPIWLEVKP